jgi:nucleotide sugar dehydrogenase
MGLGYVGLTLAAVLAEEGFLVTGVEPDARKVERLLEKNSYVHEPGINEILSEQVGKNFHPGSQIPDDGDVFIISVGTPVEKNSATSKPQPQLRFIERVSGQIGDKLRPGNLVILRSTVPIGTCRNVVLPILEKKSGLKCGTEFHLSFAPERTAEGKALKELRALPQIIGGFNEDSAEATAALFRELTSNIIRVSSLEAAETVKLVNNTFRDLIFAYANHVAQITSHFNIDVHEVIKAANQGYARDPVPLPSPGVGGPCLTKDPYIFAEVAERSNVNSNLFELGRGINESMHDYLVDRLENQLGLLGKSISGARILICGLAFKGKPETGDIRQSSALEIHNLLKSKTASVFGHDPVAETSELLEYDIKPVDLYEGFRDMDAVLFLNNHPFYEKLDIFRMVRSMADKPIILDGWHLFHADDILKSRPCIYMGLSVVRSSVT